MSRGRSIVLLSVLLAAGVARAERAAPSLVEARLALGRGDHAEAERLATKLAGAREGAELGRSLLLLGKARGERSDWSGAVSAYEQAGPLLPGLSDRIALARGGALDRLGRHEDAVAAYREAARTTTVDAVAMQADLGATRASLLAGERGAVLRALKFLRRYPDLPEANDVRFLIARDHEDNGQSVAASQRYRELWLGAPTSRASEPARQRLEALAASGARVARVQDTERLDRARALLSARDFDAAELELLALLGTARGATRLFALRELALLAYRRGEIDRARELLEELREARGPVGPMLEWCELRSGDPSGAARRILGGRSPSRTTPPGKLTAVAELYLDAGMYEEAHKVLAFLSPQRAPGLYREKLPWILYKTGSYDAAIPGLERLPEQRWGQGRRGYWVGRAHHQAGRPCEARAAYESAIAADSHGYYALWARQRLAELRDEVAAAVDRGEPLPRCPAPEGADGTASRPAPARRAATAAESATTSVSGGETETPEDDPVEEALPWTAPDPLQGWELGPRQARAPTDAEMLERFDSLVEAHGKVVPWLARARDLWASGHDVEAGEELRQARAAARGWASESAGLPRLWGGRPRVRRPVGARPRFDREQWAGLETLARGVGETGLALRISRPGWGDTEGWHPLAYETRVRRASERHGVQPELIWAIMRIESYFNRYAVSHAHAVGLMQILPRTGRRVARLSGRDDYEIADLMSPEPSLELASWYLAALLERFHGAVPLAIASYNGGPHNVAHWIARRADRDEPLPLDELLEEIPFSETYRYVRRVLGSMAVYHAYAGLPPPELPAFVERDVTRGVNF